MNILGRWNKILVEKDGANIIVTAYKIGRKGSKAPWDIYYKYQNRWITPFEQKIKNWKDSSLGNQLKYVYGDFESTSLLRNLIYDKNPLLKLISKDKSVFSGTYMPVPLNLKVSE